MTLNREPPLTISALADDLVMDRTTVTANLKPLERRGLIEIHPDEEDKRARRLFLTQEGHAILAQAVPLWEQAQSASLESLSSIDLTAFRSAMKALAD